MKTDFLCFWLDVQAFVNFCVVTVEAAAIRDVSADIIAYSVDRLPLEYSLIKEAIENKVTEDIHNAR